jgi:hypothetical protein
MLTQTRPLDRATVEALYREKDVRLTPEQLAACFPHLQRPLPEVLRLNIPAGKDGMIGRAEISAWPR